MMLKYISLTFILILLNICQFQCKKQCFNQNNPNNILTPNKTLKLSIKDSIKDFQSGSYSIINSNVNSSVKYNYFNISLLYINSKSNYDIVTSIKQIQNYVDKQGLDFSIRFVKSGSIIKGIFLISSTSVWTSVNIHYIISAREDFRVGTFMYDVIQATYLCNQTANTSTLTTTMNISHKLVRPWKGSKKLVFGLPFLSGIKTADNQINIIFNKSSFNINQSLFQFPIITQHVSHPVQFLLISYLIVSMDSDFQMTNIFDLSYIPTDINTFIGMTGVKTAPNISKGPAGVLKDSLNPNNILNKNKFYQFFKVQGFVIQSQSNLDLLFSSNDKTTQNILQCISVQKCYGIDGYMRYTQNQNDFLFHSECVLCQMYSSYNNITDKCECRQLYTRVSNGSCVKKTTLCLGENNQIFNESTKTCDCLDNFARKDGVCVLIGCPTGFVKFKDVCYRVSRGVQSGINTQMGRSKSSSNSNLVSKLLIENNSQVSSKIVNQSTKNNIIQSAASLNTLKPAPFQSFSRAPAVLKTNPSCSVSTMIVNPKTKICECPQNSFEDKINKKCVKCNQNQQWNKTINQCACINNTYKIKGICQKCNQKAYFNGITCQCQRGYIGNGKNCTIDSNFIIKPLGLIFDQRILGDNVIVNSIQNQNVQNNQKIQTQTNNIAQIMQNQNLLKSKDKQNKTIKNVNLTKEPVIKQRILPQPLIIGSIQMK